MVFLESAAHIFRSFVAPGPVNRTCAANKLLRTSSVHRSLDLNLVNVQGMFVCMWTSGDPERLNPFLFKF